MTNDNNSKELEQLRQQMGELKSLLHDKLTVDDDVLRRSMKSSIGKGRKDLRVQIIMALAAIPVYCLLIPRLNLPIWFNVFSIALFLTAFAALIISARYYMPADLPTRDLTTVAERVVAYKKFGITWLKFSIPILTLWLVMFFRYINSQDNHGFSQGLMIGGVIGVVIGLTLGIANYRQSLKRLNDIIGQIKEVKEEEHS